jgi:hypothetical protein
LKASPAVIKLLLGLAADKCEDLSTRVRVGNIITKESWLADAAYLQELIKTLD